MAMATPLLMLIVAAICFAAGYGIRAYKSYRRRYRHE
jgi:hypothetical protein